MVFGFLKRESALLSCLQKYTEVSSTLQLERVFIFKTLPLAHPSHRAAVGGEPGELAGAMQRTWKVAPAFRARIKGPVTHLGPTL